MKRILIPAIIAAVPAVAAAQSPVQADALSQTELRGTARFMGMGGAFTALGGDLSTLGQNPAGIGVYSRSDVGITLDINMRGYKSETSGYSFKENQTKAFVNNLAYVGAINLDGALRNFNWGVSYGRKTSFDRITKGYNYPTQNSLTNYIAAFSSGYSPSDLGFGEKYNPYLDSDCDWLSILGYTSYMINPSGTNQYAGLYVPSQTTGDAAYVVRESGYVDEYNIDFGGNISDVVYWGIGVGINDLSYFRYANYSESMENARVISGNSIVKGNAGFNLTNDNHIWGSGCNVKLGLIVRPINELRIGLAVHTPTWYSLNHSYKAYTDYSYYDPNKPEIEKENPYEGGEETDWASFSSKLNTPWRLMLGVAGVIDNRAIISLDYERQFYNSMTTKRQSYNGYYYNSFESADDVNDAIDQYYKGSDIIRVGLEYRVTPQFSLRLGYNAQTSNVTKDAEDGMYEIMTTGTDPSYSFDKTTQYITAGLGYRYKMWYIDLAYQHTLQKGVYNAYTPYAGNTDTPCASLSRTYNNIVISTGFRF